MPPPDQLAARARAGDGDGSREMAATLAPFWAATARLDQSRGLPAKALRVARALDEPGTDGRLITSGPRPAGRPTD